MQGWLERVTGLEKSSRAGKVDEVMSCFRDTLVWERRTLGGGRKQATGVGGTAIHLGIGLDGAVEKDSSDRDARVVGEPSVIVDGDEAQHEVR